MATKFIKFDEDVIHETMGVIRKGSIFEFEASVADAIDSRFPTDVSIVEEAKVTDLNPADALKEWRT